jgi:hypothetical protein
MQRRRSAIIADSILGSTFSSPIIRILLFLGR